MWRKIHPHHHLLQFKILQVASLDVSSRKNNTVLVAEEEKEEKSDVVVLRSHDSSRESKNSFRDPRSMAFAFRSLRNTNDSTLRLSKQRGDLLSMLKKRRRSNNK